MNDPGYNAPDIQSLVMAVSELRPFLMELCHRYNVQASDLTVVSMVRLSIMSAAMRDGDIGKAGEYLEAMIRAARWGLVQAANNGDIETMRGIIEARGLGALSKPDIPDVPDSFKNGGRS